MSKESIHISWLAHPSLYQWVVEDDFSKKYILKESQSVRCGSVSCLLEFLFCHF